MATVTKNDIVTRIDQELQEFEKSKDVIQMDGENFSYLFVKTGFRNALNNIPLSEPLVEMLNEKENILHEIFNYWAELDYGETFVKVDRDDFYKITSMYLEKLLYDKTDSQLYEKVKTNTNSGGTTESTLPATVTLLAAPAQTKLLAELETDSKIHLVLVYRGSTENADKFIAKQDNYLSENDKAEEN